MDKNTIIGFVLIGLVLVVFSWLSRPSAEQLEARRRYQDSIAAVQREEMRKIVEAEQQRKEAEFKQAEETDAAQSDSLRQSALVANYGVFASAAEGTEEFITLENDKIEVVISTKGGQVCHVRVKDYVTYGNEPLLLFDKGDAKFNLTLITATNRVVNTEDLYFEATPVPSLGGETGTSPLGGLGATSLRLPVGENGFIDFVYTLKPDDYILRFEIRTGGLNGVLAPSTNALDIQWEQKLLSQEKGRKLENQYTGLYYKFAADEVEHFGEAKDEDKALSNRLKWIGYKNKFFASVLIADDAFSATNLSAKQIAGSGRALKMFSTTTSVPFSLTQKETTGFNWFFGPTKYKLLKSYDKGVEEDKRLELDELVPMGYRWARPISKYFILPIFDFLGKYISNYGIIIFLLTLAVKIVLSPLTYKGYISTAKMRVLKPQVEALKLKFPKKEQAMELQQATMALYSSVGASPMSGCLPMMLPMIILIPLYWLFPTAIELRQQSFLWAEDLSTYDDVIRWSANIPLISSFLGNHLSLFCLLMTVVNIVYTKVNMSMNNTGQQQMPGMNMMMYLMPIMFLFIFNQSSSGLSYYYLVFTLLSILQTWIFRFTINEDKLLAQLEEHKKKPKKKSGFMQRLEEAQRQQREQLRKQQAERDRKMRSGKR
ncbi:MAG: membrane protein insertase YidC [Tannerella sp.]|jgi:YidC/Oxa1 family membrane protein insertase|nr:membrane protein insertase YidC [Tannerella sp.]